MPRYCFTVIYSDLTELGDLRGTQLRNDAAAIEVARRVFNDFYAEYRPGVPNPTVNVKNEVGEGVYRYPTN